MFMAGLMAQRFLSVAVGPYIVTVSTSLRASTSGVLTTAIDPTGLDDGDLLLCLSCCYFNANLAQARYAGQILERAGNTSSGVDWRAAVDAFDYDPSVITFNQFRTEATGITAGMYGCVVSVKGADQAATYHDWSQKYHSGSGYVTPTFNALDVLAGSLVLACTFLADDAAGAINQGPDTGWTRVFSFGSTSGNDGRIVIDAYTPSADGTITPQSPRSNGISSMWGCIAVCIPGP